MDTVKVGERRTFRSTLQDHDGAGILVRLYTNQQVDVIEDLGDPDPEADIGECLFRVRADDGVVFVAWETELIPHGSSAHVMPDGEWVTDPEFKFISDGSVPESR